ncbi:type II secretion system protein [Halarcobacter anaerophilus]|uniref:Type II secretion system protein n=1 Tax=Halarcobacter anaerophilus TaxID=877500 RepID=A0A4Q0XZA8_9BACT|nr:type II secretion system protein [Halarcobacter anaerophilus]QDF29969.1 hypothetical protein AANAER_2523 [Halarcobacter anaerophilus]RXJ63020.1 hypothetical protein CRV06_07095 [Halarcobacter anaerophilus]
MKRSFSLLELILIILLLSICYYSFFIKIDKNNLEDAANRIVLYLKQTRYQALVDSKEAYDNKLWHKKRWTFKFFRCKQSIGGIYYIIYSDENMKGHPNIDEAISDPLTNKKIYSSNSCETNSNTSKYVLLTKEYGISDVNISCNMTSSLGQISFGNDGKVYSKLSNYENQENKYEIKQRCKIELKSEEGREIGIIIEPKSGYTYIE